MSATRGNLTSARRTSAENSTNASPAGSAHLANANLESRSALRFDRFVLLPHEGRLLGDGADVPLAPKPFETLQYLLRHPGRLVGKQELLEAVWPDTFITDDGLVQCVVDIRRALGDSAKAPRFIQTVPKRGYRMLAPVVVEDVSQAESAPDLLPRETEVDSGLSHAQRSAVPPVLPDTHTIGTRGARNRQWVTAALILLLLIAVGTAAFWREMRPGPEAPAAYTPESGLVVMLPAQMVDGLDDLAWLRTGLLDVVATEITRWPPARLVPRHRLESAMDRTGLKGVRILSLDQGLTLARDLGAERLVTGSIQRVNERFVFEASIVDVLSGQKQRDISVHGDRRSDLLDVLARFSHELGEALGVAGSVAITPSASALSTSSLDAYRAYSEALEREGRGGREESADAEAKLKQAVALDRAFARAYVRLALVQQARRRWGYGSSDPRPAVEAARKLTGQLPEREGLLVSGLAYLLLDRDSSRALDAWTTLLRMYPAFAQEAGVPTLVADTLMQQGNWGQVILATAAYVDAPAVPRSERALLHSLLAKAFRKQGEFDRAIVHINRATDLWPAREGPALLRVRTILGRILVDAGRSSEAVDVFKELAADPRADVGIVTDAAWGLYMAGRRAEAGDLVERAIALDASYGNAYHLRGWLQLTGGRPAEAAKAFEEAWARTPSGFGVPEQGLIGGDVAALYYAGVALSRAGDRDAASKLWRRVYDICAAAARSTPASLKASPSMRWHASSCAALAAARLGIGAPAPGRLEGDDATYYLMQARLEAVRERYPAALDALRQAVSLRVGDLQHVADDPNFEQLAGDPVFRQLVRGGG